MDAPDEQLDQLDELQLPDAQPAPVSTGPQPAPVPPPAGEADDDGLLPEEHRRYGVYDITHQRYVGELHETYEQAVEALEQVASETGHSLSVEPV